MPTRAMVRFGMPNRVGTVHITGTRRSHAVSPLKTRPCYMQNTRTVRVHPLDGYECTGPYWTGLYGAVR